MATRLNFANWRMVDLDNYMGGNPPFTQLGFEDPWERLPDFVEQEKIVSEDYLREPMEKSQKEQLFEHVRKALDRLDQYEPNSNAQIGLENLLKKSE